jgi:hypothetical protein
MEFAKEGRSRGNVTNPAVIGAVIDLGFCLDLISSTGIEAVKAAHEDFLAYAKEADKPVPKNRLRSDKLLNRQGRAGSPNPRAQLRQLVS